MDINLFSLLIEKAKTDHKLLKKLKTLAVEIQHYELGAAIRDMENTYHPETDEQKKEKENVKKLDLVFRMVELKIESKMIWLISNTLNVYKKKKGKFDLKDAATLVVKSQELFD